jgi:hypothetical protein
MKACAGGFKVRSLPLFIHRFHHYLLRLVHYAHQFRSQEAKDNTITLEDDDPEAVGAMIEYFYRHMYEVRADHQGIVLHVKVAALADKYMITPLGALAYWKFAECLEKEWDQEAMCDAIREVYTTADEDYVAGLKNALLVTVDEHSAQLFDKSSTSFRATVADIPEFLKEYSTKFATKPPPKESSLPDNAVWYKCPGSRCQSYGASFCIENQEDVPETFVFSCPLGCHESRAQSFWKHQVFKQT